MSNTRRRLARLAAALALTTLVGLAGLAAGGFSELPSAGYVPSAMSQGAGAPVAGSVIGTVAGVIAGATAPAGGGTGPTPRQSIGSATMGAGAGKATFAPV
jgi:hypothetical protein